MTSALKRTSSQASHLQSAASMDHVDNAAAAAPGERVGVNVYVILCM